MSVRNERVAVRKRRALAFVVQSTGNDGLPISSTRPRKDRTGATTAWRARSRGGWCRAPPCGCVLSSALGQRTPQGKSEVAKQRGQCPQFQGERRGAGDLGGRPRTRLQISAQERRDCGEGAAEGREGGGVHRGTRLSGGPRRAVKVLQEARRQHVQARERPVGRSLRLSRVGGKGVPSTRSRQDRTGASRKDSA